MDGAERNDRTLRRIMAMLVAFAVLAERTAGRSFPVRWLVLQILRRAESVALAYVAEVTGMDGSFFDRPSCAESSPADATCVALRFRLLAAMLALLLPPALCFGRRQNRIDGAPRSPSPRGPSLRPMAGGHARWFCDTS